MAIEIKNKPSALGYSLKSGLILGLAGIIFNTIRAFSGQLGKVYWGWKVIRPDKNPIGGLQSAIDRTFTNHMLQLQHGDTLYLFTDGYADQFGGENGKKMMTSKFKEMLVSIQNMNMRQQEHYLKDYFEQWKMENEQVDDVLVIGVRL
jgi:hypothetical protein